MDCWWNLYRVRICVGCVNDTWNRYRYYHHFARVFFSLEKKNLKIALKFIARAPVSMFFLLKYSVNHSMFTLLRKLENVFEKCCYQNTNTFLFSYVSPCACVSLFLKKKKSQLFLFSFCYVIVDNVLAVIWQ